MTALCKVNSVQEPYAKSTRVTKVLRNYTWMWKLKIQIFNGCQPWETWTDGTDATLRWGRGGTEAGALKVNFFADMVVPLDLYGFLETGKRVELERSFGVFDFPLLQNKGRVLFVLELVFLSTHVTPKTSSRFLISLDMNKTYLLSWSLNFTRSLIRFATIFFRKLQGWHSV